MKGIEVALQGKMAKDAELRRSDAGREWLALQVETDAGADWVSVGSWSHTIQELAPALTAGTEVYVEGKLKIHKYEGRNGAERYWLTVQASLVQPLGVIGQKKPKRTRAPAEKKKKKANGSTAYQTSAAVNAPLPFDDDIPL